MVCFSVYCAIRFETMFKYGHEILPFTSLAEADLCLHSLQFRSRKGEVVFFQKQQNFIVTVACSYLFIAAVREILDYTHNYRSKDPWIKSTCADKINVLALHTIYSLLSLPLMSWGSKINYLCHLGSQREV